MSIKDGLEIISYNFYMSKTVLMAIVIVLALIFTILIKESKEELPYKTLENDSTILAFGDSLTYGFGASIDSSYPSVMQNKTGIRIINAGVNGELSYEGLKRLPKLLLHKPDLVILCHGGNDIIQNLSNEQLKINLLEMIRLIKNSGSQILLVGVPDFNIVGFNTLSVYKEVAHESGVMYEDEVLKYIELHRALKSDYIHPNEKGYEMMADTFIKLLKKYKVIQDY